MKETHILMIGMGLIGGSLCLSLKENENVKITGYSHDETELVKAMEKGLINTYSLDLKRAVIDADVIFICTPTRVTIEIIARLAKFNLKKNVVITDVCSTKVAVTEQAKAVLPKGLSFIGGHPMAGSHKSGVDASRKNLFENAYYIFTPNDLSRARDLSLLENLLAPTKSKFITMSPKEHDTLTGMISHMPHIIASGLVNLADSELEKLPGWQQLAAGGFRDITRIASSNAQMWTDILLTNSELLLGMMDSWEDRMFEIKKAIQNKDESEIYGFFEEAKNIRDSIPEKEEGILPSFYDVYIDVPDFPGAIAEVTGLLAKYQLSLINLRIIETRIDVYGILQLTFKTKSDAKKAKNVLETQTIWSVKEYKG